MANVWGVFRYGVGKGVGGMSFLSAPRVAFGSPWADTGSHVGLLGSPLGDRLAVLARKWMPQSIPEEERPQRETPNNGFINIGSATSKAIQGSLPGPASWDVVARW